MDDALNMSFFRKKDDTSPLPEYLMSCSRHGLLRSLINGVIYFIIYFIDLAIYSFFIMIHDHNIFVICIKFLNVSLLMNGFV